MPESLPTAPAEPLPTEEPYRPIAGLAIAALVVASVFAVIVVVNGAVGLIAGMPLMLSGWLLLLPVAAIVLAIVAQRQIRASEGTRAGNRIAAWGLRLGVLFGLGYGAYAAGTYFAVRHQVEDFLYNPEKGFFAYLKRPDGVNAAFLLTQPPTSRGSLSDQDNERLERTFKQALFQFRDSLMVRITHQGGSDAEIRPQSVSGMKYEQGGFALDVTVEVATPERSVLFALTVRGKEGAATDKWFVDFTLARSVGPGMETERGRELRQLRLLSHAFVARWLHKLQQRDIADALKQTLAPAEFVPGGKAIQKRIANEKARARIDRIFDPAATRADVDIEATLGCCVKDPRGAAQEAPPPAYWRLKGKDRLEIAHDLKILLPAESVSDGKVMCSGQVFVQRIDTEPFKLDPSRAPKWRISRVEIASAYNMGQGAGPPARPPSRPE